MDILPHRSAPNARSGSGPAGYQNPFVLRAIRACAGSQSELARRIGGRCRQGHISKWLKMQRLSVDACVWLRDATRHTADPLCLRQMLAEQVRLVERAGGGSLKFGLSRNVSPLFPFGDLPLAARPCGCMGKEGLGERGFTRTSKPLSRPSGPPFNPAARWLRAPASGRGEIPK